MASNFENFLNSSSAGGGSPKSYEDFSNKIWGTAGTLEFPPETSAGEGMNAAQRFIEFSRQHAEISQLTENAKIENDPAGHGLRNLVAKYGRSGQEMKVELSQSLVDKYGGDPNKLTFGAKTMNSEEDKERMKQYVDTARQYLENIDLHFLKGKDGRDVAVVMGADAREFNAVIVAEQTKAQLGRMVEQAHEEMHGQSKVQKIEVAPATNPDLDMDKWKKLAASLPSKADPDREAAIAPLPAISPQQREKEKAGGIAA